MAEPDEFGARNRPHISIDAYREAAQYGYPARDQKRKPLRDDYRAHADALLGQLVKALGELPEAAADTRLRVEGLKQGAVVEVATAPPAEGSRSKAAKIPAALGFPGQDIVLLRTERRDDRTESALLFVPDDARGFLRDRIAAYGRDPGNARRPDVDRFEGIETIAAAPARTLFVGAVDLDAPDIVWWELWVQGGAGRVERVAVLAGGANLDVHADRLLFPDTTVIFVHATAAGLLGFAERVPGAIMEIRRATGTIKPFLDRRGAGVDQHEWVSELAERVLPAPDNVPVVCALDTGVAAEHPLVRPGLKGAWAYDVAWGTDDHAPHGGHGTAIAGLILYGDLEPHMNSTEPVELTHGAESMKLLPPHGFPATKPPSYGVVTQGSIALVEAERPNVLRSFCLATSATDFSPSRPSSWSGQSIRSRPGRCPATAWTARPRRTAPSASWS